MRGIKGSRGVTLVEFTVVLAIITILFVALGFSFAGWLGRYSIEKQTKEIYSDLMAARLMAFQRNRAHFAHFQDATTYRIIEDTNDNGDNNAGAGDEVLPSYPRTLDHPVSVNGFGVPVTFKFVRKGTMSPLRTLWISHSTDPDYDCIVISTTRINMGQMVNGSCVQR